METKEELEKIKRRRHVSDPFGWMFDWIRAYDKQNNTKQGEIIIEWINQQPTQQG